MTGEHPGHVAWVIAVTGAVAAVLTVAADTAPPRVPASIGYRLILLGLLVLACSLQVHVRHRNRTTVASDLYWVALAVGAVAVTPAVLVASAALGKLVSQVILRVPPVKTTFNTVTAAASSAAASATLASLPGVPVLPALGLGLTAGWLVNHLALAAVLVASGSREAVTWQAVAAWATHGATTSAIGVLLAAAWAYEPATVVLFVVPALVLHAAGRALVEAVAERRRLASGAAASRVLSRGPGADLSEYCGHLAAAVGAAQAVLIATGGVRPVTVPSDPPPYWLGDVLERLDGDEPIAVDLGDGPLSKVLAVRLPGRPGTLLALADPTGARDRLATELAFVASAASEVEAFVEAESLRALADARLSQLETVVAAVAEGIVTVDAAGRVLAMNAAAGRITGRDPSTIGEDAPLARLGLERPDGTPWQPDLRHRAAAERLQVRRADGVRSVDVSVAPAVLDDAPGAVLVLRDVTAAVAREQVRRSFLVGLGHELRTPLTPLLGWAQTLQRRPGILDGPARDTVIEAIGTQSQRLARLVENLLTAVDPQTMVSNRRPVDLVELAEREVAVAAPVLHTRTVRVLAREPVVLTSSPAALSHVVGNLLSNVARYVPDSGGAVVHVRREGDQAVLTVLDDGPGVPLEQREAVFELFTHGAAVEANPGAGVGLTTSRALARVLGGDLACVDPVTEPVPDVVPVPRSARPPGPGAAFRLSLPVEAPASTGSATAFAAQLFS